MAKTTSMPYNIDIEFIEAPLFSKLVYNYLNENEYAALQWTLVARPIAGDVIPGSGGLRKIRWTARDRDKRGGTRIIYYYLQKNKEIWLIAIYAKNEVENIPVKTLKLIKEALNI
jgi:hypothetical protein